MKYNDIVILFMKDEWSYYYGLNRKFLRYGINKQLVVIENGDHLPERLYTAYIAINCINFGYIMS